MTKKTQHRNITDEHREEARRLKGLWNKIKIQSKMNPKRFMSQDEFGEVFDIGNQSAVSKFLNATLQLNLDVAIKFANGLGVSVADFSPRLAKEMVKIAEAAPSDEDDFVAVKMLDVSLSAGHGASCVDVAEEAGVLHFKRSYMASKGIHINNSAVVNIVGDSMEPTINDGSVVLINRNDISPTNGNIYAFVHDGDLLIKRFFFDNDAEIWIARSDNKKYKDLVIDENTIILGRALWVGMSL